jgi:hypothetical protein
MIYWPEKILRTALSGTGVRLESGPAYRTVLSGNGTVVRIDYDATQSGRWSGTARYRNVARHYSIDIRSVEVPQ